MPSWDPSQYSTFLDWRTRPSRDLLQRVDLVSPRQVIDLGCGPGNSTALCAERWPAASIIGLDSSSEMIEAARTSQPDRHWRVGDIGAWALEPTHSDERVDVIVSCAALQWVDNHADMFPRLIGKLAPGGVLAAQMPAYDAIPNRVMREMAASERWRKWFPAGRANEWRSHTLEFYYDVLAPCTKWLDLWATDYLHIMPDVNGIVEWYKGTGLRPYLDCIDYAGERQEFLDEYGARLSPLFPQSQAGGVPFLFRRIFIMAGA
jgi:trans-aconitate 2-methyltransferase